MPVSSPNPWPQITVACGGQDANCAKASNSPKRAGAANREPSYFSAGSYSQRLNKFGIYFCCTEPKRRQTVRTRLGLCSILYVILVLAAIDWQSCRQDLEFCDWKSDSTILSCLTAYTFCQTLILLWMQ